MGLKDTIQKERMDLQSVKRPYETVAFILFSLLFLQNIYYIVKETLGFIANAGFNVFNFSIVMNLSGFIGRISSQFNPNWLRYGSALLLFAIYWAVIYFFVWNYCKKNNLAKWTWTLIVVYLPVNIFFVPAYVWFVIYIFRPYIFRFVKKGIEEYKQFDSNTVFEEEKADEFDPAIYDQYITDEPVYEEPVENEEIEEKEEK